ncbi:MAG: DUF1311 domain-containing protein [Bacteroidales bacterium]|nr:DUF1311 domain-containing protein [Bacteroidales bacterium]
MKQKEILIIATAALLIFAVSCGQQRPKESVTVTVVEADFDFEDGRHSIDVKMDREIEEDESTFGYVHAFGNAAEAWEKEIDKIYQTLMTKLQGDCRNKLQTAQKAWLAFKEDETTFINSYWAQFSGSMFSVFSASHRLFVVRQRAFQLYSYYDKNIYAPDCYLETDKYKTEEEWDKVLNENYQALMKKLGKENQDKMRAAQRKWLAYRDAEDDCYNSCCLLIVNPDYLLLLIQERALRLGKYSNDFDSFYED